MLRVALGNAGHVVATAVNGSDALALTTNFQPEVGVLDIGLPGMDGYELARLLRKSNAAILLIALTGYGQAPTPRRRRAPGSMPTPPSRSRSPFAAQADRQLFRPPGSP